MRQEIASYIMLVVAVLGFLANQGDLFPAGYYKYINVSMGILGIIAAFLKDNRSIFPVKQ
jgi:hypothetical protein